MHEHAQPERPQPITPGSPDVPHVGWREVVTREHLPRLLVLCLAIWLHAANTMLAATTMPEAVVDIGSGIRVAHRARTSIPHPPFRAFFRRFDSALT